MAGIHEGHRDRVRQRVLREGLSALQQHELLEYLLLFSATRQDMNPTAHALIQRFGSLEGVLLAEEAELRAVPGMGPRRADWLKRLLSLAESYASLGEGDRPMLGTLRQVRRFGERFLTVADGGVWQLSAGRSGRLLLASRIAEGSVWGESMALRDALEDVLGVRASSVVLLQRSPDPVLTPEPYDLEHTAAYSRTLAAVGVHLLDHVVLGRNQTLSMARDGLLEGPPCQGTERALLMERYLRET